MWVCDGKSEATNNLKVGTPEEPLGAIKTVFADWDAKLAAVTAKVPLRVKLPDVVTEPDKVNPETVPVPPIEVTVPEPVAVLNDTASNKDTVLSNTDIFAFPTFYKDECFPLGLLEALRWSLPVITTNEGAITEIVKENVNGYIIEQHNSLALADKLEILINNPNIRKQMGAAGRSKFEKEFTLDVFENKMAYLLNDILKNSVN